MWIDFFLLVSHEPEGDFAHTQQFHDYLTHFQVRDECDESRHVSAQVQIGDKSGKERSNSFVTEDTSTLTRNVNSRLPRLW